MLLYQEFGVSDMVVQVDYYRKKRTGNEGLDGG